MPWVKECCRGCGICVKVCEISAIVMKGDVAVINQDICTKCGACLSACPFNCIRPNSENSQLRGGSGRGGGKGSGGFGRVL
ncbi:MAG: 4Fe-4S binding protein [Spirochaetes bacterium]|nr:4Fe-4S binding protein [Spirochaetota bacterium]MBN2772141.1 4Fe-4S binding protein [Spirochaetota bacterium]